MTLRIDLRRTAAITTIDAVGRSVSGACLQIADTASVAASVHSCDKDDGATDGVVHFPYVPPAAGISVARSYGLAPTGLSPGPDVALTFTAGHADATYVSPAHGHLDSFSEDTFNYTPNPGYLGTDSFTYTISNSSGETATATVNITVTPGIGSVRANVLYADSGLAIGEQACFELLDGGDVRVGSVQCLNPAGQTAVFSNVPLGDYSVAVAYTVTFPPVPRLPARYEVPAPIQVAVTRDGLAEIVTFNIGLKPVNGIVAVRTASPTALPRRSPASRSTPPRRPTCRGHEAATPTTPCSTA